MPHPRGWPSRSQRPARPWTSGQPRLAAACGGAGPDRAQRGGSSFAPPHLLRRRSRCPPAQATVRRQEAAHHQPQPPAISFSRPAGNHRYHRTARPGASTALPYPSRSGCPSRLPQTSPSQPPPHLSSTPANSEDGHDALIHCPCASPLWKPRRGKTLTSRNRLCDLDGHHHVPGKAHTRTFRRYGKGHKPESGLPQRAQNQQSGAALSSPQRALTLHQSKSGCAISAILFCRRSTDRMVG